MADKITPENAKEKLEEARQALRAPFDGTPANEVEEPVELTAPVASSGDEGTAPIPGTETAPNPAGFEATFFPPHL